MTKEKEMLKWLEGEAGCQCPLSDRLVQAAYGLGPGLLTLPVAASLGLVVTGGSSGHQSRATYRSRCEAFFVVLPQIYKKVSEVMSTVSEAKVPTTQETEGTDQALLYSSISSHILNS